MTTWNPADLTAITLSNGNLTETATAAASGVRSTISFTTAGKFYFELRFNSATPTSVAMGIATGAASLTGAASTGANAAIVNGAGTVNVNGTNLGTGLLGAFSNGGTLCVAWDVGAQHIWFRNGAAGNWNGSGTADPVTGVGNFSVAALGTGTKFVYAGGVATGTSAIANFGASAFVGTIPSGYGPWDITGTLSSTGGLDSAGFMGTGGTTTPPPGPTPNPPNPNTTVFHPNYPTPNYPRPPLIAPIVVYDQLRDEIHGYQLVTDMYKLGRAYFDFNTWARSVYDIINTTATVLPVLLNEQTYSVGQNEWWRFIAHDEIGTNDIVYHLVGGQQLGPYWDTLLGGSFWDSYQSPWDGGRF